MLESGKLMPSIDTLLREAKADASAAGCGMYLTHNGVVRATPKAEVRGVETDGVAPGHRALQALVGTIKNECVSEVEREA